MRPRGHRDWSRAGARALSAVLLLVLGACAGDDAAPGAAAPAAPGDAELLADPLAIAPDFFVAHGVARADEVTELRSGHGYTFRRSDGALVAVIEPGAVNYRDASRRFRPIDPRVLPWAGAPIDAAALLRSAGPMARELGRAPPVDAAFANTSNTLASYFPATADHGVLAATDDAAVRWVPTRRWFERDGSPTRIDRVAPVRGVADGATVRYAGTYPGVVEEYVVQAGVLRHDVVLAAPPAEVGDRLLFEGRLELTAGITAWIDGQPLDRDGPTETSSAIELRDPQGRPVLQLGRPRAYERADGRVAVDLAYRLEVAGDGSLVLAIVTPMAWLHDPARVYPVVIDPDVMSFDAVYSVDVSPGGTKFDTDTSDWVGAQAGLHYRSAIRFPITAIPPTAVVTDVTLRVNVTDTMGAGVRIGRVITDPQPAPGPTVQSEAGGGCGGCTQYVAASTLFATAGARTQALGATAASELQTAAAGGNPWLALGLRKETESGGARGIFTSVATTDPALWPALVVTMNLPAPEPFSLVSPANGSLGVSSRGPLRWTESTSAVRYRVRVATDPGLTALVVDTTFDVAAVADPLRFDLQTPLAENTTYFWKVTALNFAGATDDADGVWSFTTGDHPVWVWRGDLADWSATQYASVQAAIDSIGGANVSGWSTDGGGNAVVVEVRDSSRYLEKVLLDTTKVAGSSATRRFAIRAQNGQRPILEYTGADVYYVVLINGVAGAVLDGFEVRNATPDATLSAINIDTIGATDAIIRNCDIHSSLSYGLWGDGANLLLDRNRFHDNHRSGFVVAAGAGTVVRGNRIYRNWQRGASMQNVGGGQFLNNAISSNGMGSAGLQIFVSTTYLVRNNSFHAGIDGLYVTDTGVVTARNNIFSSHTDDGVEVIAGGSATLSYNLWFNNATDVVGTSKGTGEINATDPRFVDAAGGDLHVHSEWGHVTNAAPTTFVNSTPVEGTSAAIDGGDPADPFGLETMYHGQRINIGAYGNTPEASRTRGAAHLLLSEIGVNPVDETVATAEYIEIYNPTNAPIVFTNYYLTDDKLAYIDVPTGSVVLTNPTSDFVVRFPAGRSIQPGEYQVIAVDSAAFAAEFPGITPTFEITQDGAGDGVADMTIVAGAAWAVAALTNAGEVLTLFAWDQAADRVSDVDVVVWNAAADVTTFCPNKSGQSRDGPDPGTTPTTYLADACTMTAAGNGLSDPVSGEGYRRVDFAEGTETAAGGNGITTHDETTEPQAVTWAKVTLAPTTTGGCNGQPNGTACGTSTSSECDAPDTCQNSVCVPNFAAAATACTDTSAGDCNDARCNGAGTCNQAQAAEAAGYTCNAAVGNGCDAAETCTGAAGACPADIGVASGTVCRAALDPQCDAAETCDGSAAACPAEAGHAAAGAVCTDTSAGDCNDARCTGGGLCNQAQTAEAAGYTCNAAVGNGCDAAETCTGAAGACPADIGVAAGTECRAGLDPICDSNEVCDGSAAACPAEGGHAVVGTVCPDTATGDCNDARCTGTGTCNQAQAAESAGYTCNAAVGNGCDAAETCTGAAGACPADIGVASGTECRASLDPSCDTNEVCDGSAAACPAEGGHVAVGTVCPDTATGDCNDARCTGGGLCNQAQSAEAAGYTCNAAVDNGCDAAETCTGAAGACPADIGVAAGTECRASLDPDCDTNEVCDGSAAACPAEGGHLAVGTVCPDTSAGDCNDARCTGGGLCNQAQAAESPGYLCSADNGGGCDVAETCTGAAGACPADLGVASGTVCRAALDPECDTEEICNGSSSPCPTETGHAAAGAPCGDQGIQCVSNDTCSGTGSCTDNGFDDGATYSCGVSDVAPCQLGTATCSGGSLGGCVGNLDPTTETCDGLDNDCDSSPDDGGVCVDECGLGLDDCNVNATCADTFTGFTCTCVAGYIGDGVTCVPDAGWQCDTSIPPVCTEICGDGLLVGDEACDDADTEDGDGCAADCTLEDGWECTYDELVPADVCVETCGDGLVVGVEECDDGNPDVGDGCDGCAVDPGWTCDDAEPSACVEAPDCGDGIVASVEVCDDGNLVEGDGCSDNCMVEPGWACDDGEPTICTALDSDDDGVLDVDDNCPDDANPDQEDLDGDGLGDACDRDADGDGWIDGGELGGGGCTCQSGGGGSAGGSLVALVVVVGLALRRRRRGAALLALVVVAIVGAPATARAQDAHDGFAVERFRLAGDGGGLLSVDWAAVPHHGSWDAAFWVSASHDPLVVFAAPEDGGDEAARLVASRVASGLSASFALWQRVQLSGTLTGVAFQDDRNADAAFSMAAPSLPVGGLSDARLAAKLALLGGGEARFHLAVTPAIVVPLGAERGYLREAGPVFEPEVAASLELGRVRVGVELGYRLRGDVTAQSLEIGDELLASAGLGVGVGDRADLMLTVAAATAAAAPLGGAHRDAFEVLGGGTYRIGSLQVFVAGGGGVGGGYGTPDWRLVAGTRYQVIERDRDGDRLVDRRDQCPLEAEDRDGTRDGDGCPDLDDDGDGIADAVDRCVAEIEDRDDFEDDDGCPDPDDDDDGFADGLDRCPRQAEVRNGLDDDDGCPDQLHAILRGTVTGRGEPLAGAEVTIAGSAGEQVVRSDAAGGFELELTVAETVAIKVRATKYLPLDTTADVLAQLEPTLVSLTLEPQPPMGEIRGVIRDYRGRPLAARARIEPGGLTVETDADGMFRLQVPPGAYTVSIEAERHRSQSRKVRVDEDGVTVLNADLKKSR